MSSNVTKIPIFSYPEELTFYSGTRESYKQLLTLCNPYDTALKFKICSNAPDKYRVLHPYGTIRPRSSLDIVITHLHPIATNSSVVDKFMIIMRDVTNQRIGKRYVSSTLLPGEKDNTSTEDSLHYSAFCEEETVAEESKKIKDHHRSSSGPPMGRIYVLLFLGAVLSIPLFLPTAVEVQNTTVPPTFHISVTTKATLSFILGTIFACIIMPYRT